MELNKLKLHEYYNLLPVAANRKECVAWAKSRKKPPVVCDKEIADSAINLITFAEYVKLAATKDDNAFLLAAQEVFGITGLRNENAERALGFLNWAAHGVARITDLFNKASIPATSEEKAAGVEKLRFGLFGIVDWYARRMHISHAAAEETRWINLYKCLDMDVKTAIYERKLQQQYINKSKNKGKRR